MTGQTLVLRSDASRATARRLVDLAPPGSVFNIRAANRSKEQNDKMHAMIADIARAKPEGRMHSPLIWKSLLMSLAGFKPIFEHALDGEGIVPIGFKSSRLSKAEFSDLIEAIYAYGAQHGVQWSHEEAEHDRAA